MNMNTIEDLMKEHADQVPFTSIDSFCNTVEYLEKLGILNINNKSPHPDGIAPIPYSVGKINSALILRDANGKRIAQLSSGKGLPTQEQENTAGFIVAACNYYSNRKENR